MEGKIIFPYHKLQYLPQGELSIPSIAMDWPQHRLPLGAVTKPGPTRRAPESGSTGMKGASPAKIPPQPFLFTSSLLPLPASRILSAHLH